MAKKITDILRKKSGVKITFSDKSVIDISNDAFLNQYLFIGQELETKQINEIVKLSELTKYMNYSLLVLKKSHVTETLMKEKLLKKGANSSQTNLIVKRLKENDLICDDAYLEDLLCYYDEKLYGEKKIRKLLIDKKFDSNKVNSLKFSYKDEYKKAKQSLPLLEKKYSKLSSNKKKEKIYASLINNGFISEVVKDAIKEISLNNDEHNILIDYEVVFRRLSKKYEGKKLYNKLFESLRNKGYEYDVIEDILKEKKHE